MATTRRFLRRNPSTKTEFVFPATNYQPFTPNFLFLRTHFAAPLQLAFVKKHSHHIQLRSNTPFASTDATHYEFNDDSSEVELRLELGDESTSPGQIFVDGSDNSLVIRVQRSGYIKTLFDTKSLYGMIKPSETMWYIDDAQLVVNMKKQDPELKWPGIMESWESLTTGAIQLFRGTSIFLVGESTEINHIIARELAVGLGYTPLSTKELLEAYTKQSIDSWVAEEGSDAVADAECAILESLSSQARTVVATLGEKHGAATRPDKWRHLFAGFTVWLSQSEAVDEESAKEEAMMEKMKIKGYSNAEVIVKLRGWDATYSKTVAQASLSALKRLLLSNKDLPGKKSLYIRLGSRGDWPDIKPPAWDPSSAAALQQHPRLRPLLHYDKATFVITNWILKTIYYIFNSQLRLAVYLIDRQKGGRIMIQRRSRNTMFQLFVQKQKICLFLLLFNIRRITHFFPTK